MSDRPLSAAEWRTLAVRRRLLYGSVTSGRREREGVDSWAKPLEYDESGFPRPQRPERFGERIRRLVGG